MADWISTAQADRAHDTGKLHQHSIAGEFDDAPLMLAILGSTRFVRSVFQCGERTGFVDGHEPAVTNNVGGKNSSQAALHINPENLQKSAGERNTKMPQCWL